MSCDLFYISVDFQFTKYIPQKRVLNWFNLRSFFNKLHKQSFFQVTKKTRYRKMPLRFCCYFSHCMFPCYLTANAFNERVLRLQNEFLCLSCLSGNCQTVERDPFLYVLGVVHIASNSTHVQYTRTDSVCIFDLRSVRTVKAVTNREHLSYGPHLSFSSPGLHLIKDRAPWALTVRTFRSVHQACI